MKLRHPWSIKVVAWLAAKALRLWGRTARFTYRPLGPNVDPSKTDPECSYLYTFWHENLLAPVARWHVSRARVLISRSRDGQLIAEVARRLGLTPVRGSTTRGGIEAVRQILRAGGRGHVGVTPDGPLGPRRRVQPGVVYLAARTGLPVVPVGFGFQRALRMASWDRFVVPGPWTRVTCVSLAPFVIPPEAGRAELEQYRQCLEQSLHFATELAERWAATGRWPEEAARRLGPAPPVVSSPQGRADHAA
jgi:lysophospholipid acyltransferase (LPLAT)-like uncharacterized protein